MAKRLALPVRRQMNLTEDAYARLRDLSEKYGLGNNYLLTILLEHYDELVDKESEERVFGDFIAEYGAPEGARMGAKKGGNEMKLYCFGQSGHSYKVANYLNLAGLEFEPVYIDFFNGETRSEAYQQNINEMGEAPVLVDGDIKLTQSGVILDYLVEKYGAFAPSDARENWRWVLWDNHKMSSQAGFTRFMMNFLPEEKRSPDVIAFLQGRLNGALRVLNDALDGREFLLGESLSPADFSCSSYLWYPEDFGFARADYPHIDAWMGRIENMPNWKHPYDLMPTDQAVLNATPNAAKWHKEG